MSTPAPVPPPAGRPPGVSAGHSRAQRDQLICIALAAILLAGIFALQPVLTAQRDAMIKQPAGASRDLAVAFPRLTLSGFRGLLATVLWIQAEDDKNNHKWKQLESDYTYIATLEPYFASVYVFNSWNQAYNLSAQWHNDKDKYKWVIDGLTHLYEGEEYSPNHPDLLVEEGHMFMLKLGSAYERIFYRKHWRYDLAHLYELNSKPGVSLTVDTSEAREVLKIVLGDATHRRNEFHASLLDGGHGLEIRDYLPDQKDPIPFRYGISPFYFAYCEYQRCLKQPTRPSTIGLPVVQSYPAMTQRLWCKDDLYYSADTLRQMFLLEDPETETFSPTSKPPAREEFDERVLELRDCYRNIQMVAPRAINDFEVYIKMRYGVDPLWGKDAENIHRKHVLETAYMRDLGKAESELFEGLVRYTLDNRADQGDAWSEKPRLTPAAADHFRKCIPLYETALQSMGAYAAKAFPPPSGGMPNTDLLDFQRYGMAVQARIQAARSMLTLEPGQRPDFTFLQHQILDR